MSSRQESKWMPLDKSLLSSICPKSWSKRKEFAAYMMGIPFPLSDFICIVSPPPLCVRSSTVPSVLVFIVSLSTTSRRRTVFVLHTSAMSRWTCEGLADNRLWSLRWCCWWFGRQSLRYCYGSYGGWWLVAHGVPSELQECLPCCLQNLQGWGHNDLVERLCAYDFPCYVCQLGYACHLWYLQASCGEGHGAWFWSQPAVLCALWCGHLRLLPSFWYD